MHCPPHAAYVFAQDCPYKPVTLIDTVSSGGTGHTFAPLPFHLCAQRVGAQIAR